MQAFDFLGFEVLDGDVIPLFFVFVFFVGGVGLGFDGGVGAGGGCFCFREGGLGKGFGGEFGARYWGDVGAELGFEEETEAGKTLFGGGVGVGVALGVGVRVVVVVGL